ncbi:MAG: hypothetical protein HC875_27170 [Anaerolineales bacterium]|nr:hypothetical protein [Anaerolineales bacterium]
MRRVIIIALLTLLQVLPTPLQAAPALEMTVEPGFGGRFKYGEWLPVFVELENFGPDLLGEIRVVITSPTGQLDFNLPAELPTGARKRYTLYILPNNFSRSAKVEFVVGDETYLTRQIKLAVIPNDRYVIGSVSVNMAGLAEVNPPKLAGRRERADLINLALADLPERHEGWRMLNALILNDIDTSALTPAQRTALNRWVAEGGRLVLGGGAGAARTLAGLPDELQPVTLAGQQEVAALPGLERFAGASILVPGPFLLAQAQPAPQANVLLNNEAKPDNSSALASDSALIIELPFGAGHVDFIALDLSQSPFNAWGGVSEFIEKLLSPGAAWPQFLATDIAPQQMSDSQMYYALTNLPALDLPSIRFLGLLLAGYILLVGPLNYLVLRWRDRLSWAWITIPVITLTFSGLAFGLGFGLRGSDIIINQVSIVELGQSSQPKRAQTYVGIFSPRRQSYDIQVNAETLLRPFGQGAYDPWSGAVNTGGTMRVSQGNPARMQGLTIDQWSMQSFMAETLPGEQPELLVQLTVERSSISGQVENRGSATWEDLVFIFNAQFQKLGNLAPGQTAQIRLDFEDSAPIISGFGSYMLFQDQMGQNSGMNREVTFKQSILDGTIFNSNRPDLNDQPILIAWQKNNSPLAIELAGYETDTQANTLLYYPMTLNFDTAQVSLPPGFSQLELVSATGDASTCNYGAGLDGSYVYQGTAETRLSLPSQLYHVQPERLDLYLRTDGSWPNLPTIELYDRLKESWTPLENAKTGANPLHDATRFYNPDDASLQVRISSNGGNGGGCLFLDLALEGERS